jgi:hypothetical protein
LSCAGNGLSFLQYLRSTGESRFFFFLGGIASLFVFGGLAQAGRLLQSKVKSCAQADVLQC